MLEAASYIQWLICLIMAAGTVVFIRRDIPSYASALFALMILFLRAALINYERSGGNIGSISSALREPLVILMNAVAIAVGFIWAITEAVRRDNVYQRDSNPRRGDSNSPAD